MTPKADTCRECGTCLMRCPEARYTREGAVAQIRAVNRGAAAEILSACITCMACNEYCPAGAGPFDRICDLQERHGIRLVSDDRAGRIEATLSGVPGRVTAGGDAQPALSLCVMAHALPPDMAASRLFENLTVASGSPYYSRVVHLHTGLPSRAREHAPAFIESLAALGRREIVFAHDDCYVMAAALAPAWGIRVPFAAVHLADWLGRALAAQNGGVKKLGIRAAFQRPCVSRLAPWTDRFVDGVFARVGAERVARAYDRDNARCCGIGLAEKHPDRSAGMAAENVADAQRHGAQAMVFGCPSCYAFMSPACTAAGLAPIFISDFARMALGEIPFGPRPHAG